jgi:hypothetical protein
LVVTLDVLLWYPDPSAHDVVLFNERGEVTESTIANIAIQLPGLSIFFVFRPIPFFLTQLTDCDLHRIRYNVANSPFIIRGAIGSIAR